MKALRTALAVSLALVLPATAHAQSEDLGVAGLLREMESAFLSGDPSQYVALTSRVADRERAMEFAASQVLPGATRAIAHERDRVDLQGGRLGYRLMVEVFTELGDMGRILTCRLDIRDLRPDAAEGEPDWQIVDQEVLTVIDGLFRLSLEPGKQYAARGLVIEAEDVSFRLNEGSMFVSEVPEGVTAIVLTGNGEMVFSPLAAAERRQVEIFSGDPVLRAEFDAAMIRVSPDDLDDRLTYESLVERSVDRSDFARAAAFFDEQVVNSFGLDLTDLSRETWSLVPPSGDFLAEVRTRRYGTLTYAHASSEAEDVALFDRENQRNIASYSSVRRLSIRGPFYNEDDSVAYDVEHTDLRVDFDPERQWVEGSAALVVRIRSFVLTNLTLRLAAPLAVHRVSSRRFGRLMTLRVREQNQVLITLPTTLVRGERLDLTITYGGRLPPEEQLDREALAILPQYRADFPAFRPEPRYVYSNRSLWYPQSTVTDYGTARLRLGVPVGLGCVASGMLVDERLIISPDEREAELTLFEFRTTQPARYLSAAISRLVPVAERTLVLAEPAAEADIATNVESLEDVDTARGGAFYETLDVSVVTNPRQRARGRELADQVADIMGFYSDVLGDFPYPTFTLALVEHETPGGHSPAYFALLHQSPPQDRQNWRNDPVSFSSYPEFFLAHELAHQSWGQAVGWRNYHEQWLSEGLAQYFALLYAEHQSKDRLEQVLERMRDTALEASPDGPVYLGYRLGHIRGEGRVFRSLVYNKGAMVMHMLRRLVGDEDFFRTLRRFYFAARFRKAGTDQLRRLFEEVTGRPLDRFFSRWIYDMDIPTLRFAYEVIPAPAVATAGLDPSVLGSNRPGEGLLRVRFEQVGKVFDVPVTVELEYADGREDSVIVPVVEEETEMLVPLQGEVRRVRVNEDNAALAHIES